MDKDNKKPDKNNNKSNRNIIIITLVVSLLMYYLFTVVSSQIAESNNIEKSYDEFMLMLSKDQVAEVFFKYQDNKIVFKTKQQVQGIGPSTTYYTGYISDPDLITTLKEKGNIKVSSDIIDNDTSVVGSIILTLLPFILIYGIMWLLFRNISKNSGGVMGVGKVGPRYMFKRDWSHF